MRYTRTAFSLAAALIVSACANHISAIRPAVEEKPVEVVVAVATGCIATKGRPAPVKPLKSTLTLEQWKKLAPGAKAEAIKAQSGTRLNYEDTDRAATSACK